MLTENQMRKVLAKTCKAYGGQVAWAKKHGYSREHVCEVIHGREIVSDDMIKELGYEKRFIKV